jgi:hypothetical protein
LALALAALGAHPVLLGRSGDAELLRPIETILGVAPLGGSHGLRQAVHRARLQSLLVQYVPFLYARFGLAPQLVVALRGLRRDGVRLGVFVHEPYVPFTRLPWWITGVPMRWQFRAVVRTAHVVYAATPAFLDLARKAAGPGALLTTAPTGSNIPVVPTSRPAARAALGLGAADVAVGVFSPRAAGLRASWLAAAAALPAGAAVRWVFFGAGSNTPPDGFPSLPGTLCLGWLTPERASEVFAALDVAVAPFEDGLTMRRSSAMAALAHGVPLVSSRGPLSDAALADAAICAAGASEFADALLRLATGRGLRERQGRRGRDVYERAASVEVLAAQVLRDLGAAA